MPESEQRRMYSFTVHGWKWHEGNKENTRQATIVAASNADAIAEARALLDPDGDLSGEPTPWAVVGAVELLPKEARDWARWHREASSPRGRTEAEATAQAADAATRGE